MNDWNEKKLGFGLMRLPKNDGVIDIPAVSRMVDAFLEKGFTYFDTAYVYAGSEEALRQALVERHPRESYTVASKLAGWMLNENYSPADMFAEQLRRTGLDYFDYYLLHSLQESRVDSYEQYDCWSFCRQLKAEGKIRHFGFSYHGTPALLDQLLTDHPEVEFVQLQINYVDWDSDAIYSRENYEVCRRHNRDIVIMEPVKGGILAALRPELEDKFHALDPKASVPSYALRFAGNLPGVRVVLSGMGTDAQMADNLATFDPLRPLSEAEQQVIAEVTRGLLEADTVPCTACRYCCEGCPMEINIPEIFKAYNMYLTFGDHSRPHLFYTALTQTGSGKAGDCIACGQCEAACPQHINIIERLQGASAYLD